MKTRFCFSTLLVLSILSAASCAGLYQKAESEFFTIAVLPDTQMYSEKHPEIFMAQTEWIAKNKSALKLMCVVQEGDVVNKNVEYQWQNADKAMAILDKANVPYCVAIGNHDYIAGKPRVRDPNNFNKYFGVKRVGKKKWYGGSLNNQTQNAYYLFEKSGVKMLVMCLEFGPSDAVLGWANEIASKYSDRKIIMVTHGYMNNDDTRLSPGDNHNPGGYLKGANDGEDMWEKFVRRHNNIFLVLSGHVVGDGNGRLTSESDGKTKVTQILANYQMKKNGGDGLMRLMKFVPTEDKIIVTTYSPTLKQYRDDPNDSFTIDNAGLTAK